MGSKPRLPVASAGSLVAARGACAAPSDPEPTYPVIIDELVALDDLVGVSCHVTSAGPHHPGGLVADRAEGRLMTVPTPGAVIWIVIGDRSFRSGIVFHTSTIADDATVQLVVRTMEGRYVFEFLRASIYRRVDETTHPAELGN